VIVLDTSALIAIINLEPERTRFLEVIADADRCLISGVTLLEAHMVTFGRFGDGGIERLSQWLATFDPVIIAFDESQSAAAFAAFKSFGKGVHAKARLNFGDCASYALAKSRNLALLYKGGDFAATDIVAAV
jgi:ribonuclease VapC